MLDKAVKILMVEERFRFNRFNAAEKIITYHFTIGRLGPFTEEFGAGQTSAEEVHKRLNARVLELRESGALTE